MSEISLPSWNNEIPLISQHFEEMEIKIVTFFLENYFDIWELLLNTINTKLCSSFEAQYSTKYESLGIFHDLLKGTII